MAIHPTAQVEAGAAIAHDADIGPFAYIDRDTEIGAGCRIGPHASILRYTRLGANCRVHACAVVGDVPQDLAFKDAVSRVDIGAGTTIREGVTIHRGTKEGTATRVGEQCFLMANSHLAHNVQLGNRVILANGVLLAGYVDVGDGAFLSGNALVHQFVRVGRLAMLSGGAAASKDVPPFCTMPTVTNNRVIGVNVVGLRRAGIPPEQRGAVRQAFRMLYLQGLNLRDAAMRIATEFPDGPAHELAQFVLSSKRGICAYGGRPDADDSAEP